MVVRRLVAIGARAEVTVAREVVTVMAISVSTTMSPPHRATEVVVEARTLAKVSPLDRRLGTRGKRRAEAGGSDLPSVGFPIGMPCTI